MELKRHTATTNEEFKILADPYRMSILNVFFQSKIPMTTKQVADALGEVPAKVHYHIKKLLKIKLLALHHVEIINGINAKYYMMTADSIDFDVSDDITPEARNLAVDQIAQVFLSTVDVFKEDILKRSKSVKKQGEMIKENDGFIELLTGYLDLDDMMEVIEFIRDFSERHKEPKEGKLYYSGIFGSIRKD